MLVFEVNLTTNKTETRNWKIMKVLFILICYVYTVSQQNCKYSLSQCLATVTYSAVNM